MTCCNTRDRRGETSTSLLASAFAALLAGWTRVRQACNLTAKSLCTARWNGWDEPRRHSQTKAVSAARCTRHAVVLVLEMVASGGGGETVAAVTSLLRTALPCLSSEA